MSLLPSICVLLASSLAGPGPLAAGEADVWLAKLETLRNRAPFALDYEVTVRTGEVGRELEIEGDAELLYGDRSRSVMSMSLSFAVPGLAEPVEVALLSVADGEIVWTEMQSPGTGSLQVVKIPIAGLQAMAREGGFAGMMGGATMDPMAQIDALTGLVRFRVASTEAGRVTLRGRVREDLEPRLGEEALSLLSDGLTLVLDSESGAPVRLVLGLESSPHLDARFSNLELLPGDEVGADSFTYAPPEGVEVIEPLDRAVVAP